MKKLVALAVVMLLVAGYVSASWGFGRLTHERFSIWLQKVSDKANEPLLPKVAAS